MTGLPLVMRRMLPPIDLLRAFEACVRHLSVSRAADELNLTQSAVSRQLAALEALLDLKLFHRVRRRLAPTLAGAAYAPEVRALLSQLEKATLELMAHGGAGGTLNLSVVPTFGTRWLTPRLPSFRATHPKIMLNVQNFETRPTRLDFAAEHVHAAIWFGDAPWPGTQGHRLVGEEVLPVCAPALLAGGLTCSPDALGSYVLLQNSTRPRAWPEWLAAVGATEVDGLRGPKFQHMAMIIQAAVAGLGVALVPLFLVADEMAARRLVVLCDRPVRTPQAYFLIYPDDNQDLPALRAFRDWLITEVS
jgi:LysR family transcriptional regulator, glycine cleavage system transcriptional activator